MRLPGQMHAAASLTHGVCIRLNSSEMFVPFTFEQVGPATLGPSVAPDLGHGHDLPLYIKRPSK